MIFYGHGVIWNKSQNRPLCKFDKEGKLETDNPVIIDILVDLDYPYEGETINIQTMSDPDPVYIPGEWQNEQNDVKPMECLKNDQPMIKETPKPKPKPKPQQRKLAKKEVEK